MFTIEQKVSAILNFKFEISVREVHVKLIVKIYEFITFVNQGAMDDFDEAIIHESESSHTFYNRGVLNVAIKKYKDAIFDFTAGNLIF